MTRAGPWTSGAVSISLSKELSFIKGLVCLLDSTSLGKKWWSADSAQFFKERIRQLRGCHVWETHFLRDKVKLQDVDLSECCSHHWRMDEAERWGVISQRSVVVVDGLIRPWRLLLFLLMLLHDFLHLLLQLWRDDKLIVRVRLGWRCEVAAGFLWGSVSSHFDDVVTLFLTCHWPVDSLLSRCLSSISNSSSRPGILPF